MRWWLGALLVVVGFGWVVAASDQGKVGETLLPTGHEIDPLGVSVEIHGRPVDAVASEDGSRLFVKDRAALRVIDLTTMELLQTIASPGGASLVGLALDGESVLFTNAAAGLHVYSPGDAGFVLDRTIDLPADSFPCGVAVRDGIAYVALSKANAVTAIELETGTALWSVETGVGPFDVAVDAAREQLVVSNVGGRFPTSGEATAPSAGTETPVDDRGVASTGTVTVLGLDGGVRRQIEVGRQPTDIEVAPDRGMAFVACANDDQVFAIDLDTETVDRTLDVRPYEGMLFGAMPNGLSYDADEGALWVAAAGVNAVARMPLDTPGDANWVPTGWYPVALRVVGERVVVINNKGIGSRTVRRPAEEGYNSHDHRASIQAFRKPMPEDRMELTDRVVALARSSVANRSVRGNPEADADAQPRPVPDSYQEPSVFDHVIYVIKENRTFDQIFGDMPNANTDPNLCVYPREITPNHHALADRFGLLDNYYCNGVLSADGHSWATEGNVTPYLQRAFGGFSRSYTFGDDPITYSSSGFLWDHVLTHGLSFRNYGEMDYATPPDGWDYQRIWSEYVAGNRTEFDQNIGIARLREFSSRDYPGWNMLIPDVLRMDRFLEEFAEFERNGDLPNLSIVYLPQDHFGGGITNRSHMADNDLAIGRLVEAVSESRYWPNTLIVINEDDPQNGFDHVDGHRSICLVISAYGKPGTHSAFANQTSAIRTMLHVLGVPPMNHQVASMPLITEPFQDEPDLRPYAAIVPDVPLNEAPDRASFSPAQAEMWAQVAEVPIHRTGLKTEDHEELLNRWVWHEAKGYDVSYPSHLTGPHGSGLAKLGLRLERRQD